MQGYTGGIGMTVAVLTRGANPSDGNSFLHLELYVSDGWGRD